MHVIGLVHSQHTPVVPPVTSSIPATSLTHSTISVIFLLLSCHLAIILARPKRVAFALLAPSSLQCFPCSFSNGGVPSAAGIPSAIQCTAANYIAFEVGKKYNSIEYMITVL